MPHKVIVAISGASGAIYPKTLLEELTTIEDQFEALGIIMSDNAKTVWEHEVGDKSYDQFPFPIYGKRDFSAPFASGSAKYDCMIICPCSMGTMGRIAHGVSDDLTTRAADVILKEKRQLLLMPREAPYNLIHIKNMETLLQAGATICPATPSFYRSPETIEDLVKTVTHRLLDLAGFDITTYRWGENQGTK